MKSQRSLLMKPTILLMKQIILPIKSIRVFVLKKETNLGMTYTKNFYIKFITAYRLKKMKFKD